MNGRSRSRRGRATDERRDRRSADQPVVTQKLQKVLADLGTGSRREMERWIEAGRIEVNGEQARLGSRVAEDDRIRVDGKLLGRRTANARVLLMNKAEGVICTRADPERRPTCFDGLPKLPGGRWISVGRLDINTSGLLLLVSDGTLANRLMHPSTGIDREYAARVDRLLNEKQLAQLQQGVMLDGEVVSFSDIRYYDGQDRNHWYHLTLMEGRNREVRRLFASQGVQVSRLKRVRYGPVVLPSTLRRGRWMEVGRSDVASLYRLLRLKVPVLPPQSGRNRDAKVGSVLIPYPELPAG
jgi:23S rRNA pseudouridine2605 synthase